MESRAEILFLHSGTQFHCLGSRSRCHYFKDWKSKIQNIIFGKIHPPNFFSLNWTTTPPHTHTHNFFGPPHSTNFFASSGFRHHTLCDSQAQMFGFWFPSMIGGFICMERPLPSRGCGPHLSATRDLGSGVYGRRKNIYQPSLRPNLFIIFFML